MYISLGRRRALIASSARSLKDRRVPKAKSTKHRRKAHGRRNRLNEEGVQLSSHKETQWNIDIDKRSWDENSSGSRRVGKNRGKSSEKESSSSGSIRRRSNPLRPEYFSYESDIFKTPGESFQFKRSTNSVYYKSNVNLDNKRYSGKCRRKQKSRNEKKNLHDWSKNYSVNVLGRDQRGHFRDHKELQKHYCKVESSNALVSLICRNIKGSKNNKHFRQQLTRKTVRFNLDTDRTKMFTRTPNFLGCVAEYTNKQTLNSQKKSYRKRNLLQLKKKPSNSLIASDESKTVHLTTTEQNCSKNFLMLNKDVMSRKKHRQLKLREKETRNISFNSKAVLDNYHNQKAQFSNGRAIFGSHSINRKVNPQEQNQNSSLEFCVKGHPCFTSHSRVTTEETSTDDSTGVSNPNSNYCGDIKISPQDKQTKNSKIEPKQNEHTLSYGRSMISDVQDVCIDDKNLKSSVSPNGSCNAPRRDCFASINSLSASASNLGSWGAPEWQRGSYKQPENTSNSSVKELRDDDQDGDYSQSIPLHETKPKHHNKSAPDDDKKKLISRRKYSKTKTYEDETFLSEASTSIYVESSFQNVHTCREITTSMKEYNVRG